MDKVILTVVGGGSVNWMPKLMKGFFSIKGLNSGEIRLVDSNRKHTNLIAKMIMGFNKIKNKGFEVSIFDDRKEALKNADIVWTTFSPGSLNAFWNDLEIPIKYGINLPVSMATGTSGISAALRTVPVAYEIVEDMEECCPGSWILNETNPMTAITKAMNLASKTIKTIGMCHEFHNNFPKYIEHIFNLKKPKGMSGVEYAHYWLPENGFKYTVAGLNHFIFLIKATLDEEDVIPKIREYCNTHRYLGGDYNNESNNLYIGYSDSDPFKNRFMASLSIGRQYGYISVNGDRHTIEFIPGLCNIHNGFGMKYGVLKTSIDRRRIIEKNNLEAIKKIINNEVDIKWEEEPCEQMIDIVKAILSKKSTKCMINTPNKGQITNLATGSVAETEAEVSTEKIRASYVGKLPGSIGTLCKLHSDVILLTVKAALEGSRDLFIEALSLDPITGQADFGKIGDLADELLYANKEWLPRFFK